jgi:hypothetical protein
MVEFYILEAKPTAPGSVGRLKKRDGRSTHGSSGRARRASELTKRTQTQRKALAGKEVVETA